MTTRAGQALRAWAASDARPLQEFGPWASLPDALDAYEQEVRDDIRATVVALRHDDTLDDLRRVEYERLLAAISSFPATETQDGERRHNPFDHDCKGGVRGDRYPLGGPTPTPDDRDREVERIRAAIKGVEFVAFDGAYSDGWDRPPEQIAAALYDAGLRASGTE